MAFALFAVGGFFQLHVMDSNMWFVLDGVNVIGSFQLHVMDSVYYLVIGLGGGKDAFNSM